MITYNDIYEASRKERYSEQLLALPKSFIQDVSQYFKDKKEVTDKGGELFSDTGLKNKKQLENAMVLFKELLRLRRKKLLQLAFIASETGISKRDFDNMFPFEKKLFEKIMKEIETMDKEINSELNGRNGEEMSNVLISFKEKALLPWFI
ncbi:MAG: hypothetical protein AABY22_16640, partial [Nanoarchaeota archaeon]